MSPLNSLHLAPVLSTNGMRALDATAKEHLAQRTSSHPSEKDVIQSGYELMQEAGLALFKFVQAKALDPIAIFIGGGNNGGDGLVLAKLLLQAGIRALVFSLAPESKFKNEAKLALDDYKQAGGDVIEFDQNKKAFQRASDHLHDDFKLIVDCMLGNGAKGELRPEFANAVQIINNSGLPVIAADAPTGYDSSAHVCSKVCIHATESMLFGFPRLDAYAKEGGRSFGKTVVAKLSYPEELVQQFDENIYLVTERHSATHTHTRRMGRQADSRQPVHHRRFQGHARRGSTLHRSSTPQRSRACNARDNGSNHSNHTVQAFGTRILQSRTRRQQRKHRQMPRSSATTAHSDVAQAR